MFRLKITTASEVLVTQYTFDTEKEAKSHIATLKRNDKRNGVRIGYAVIPA